MNKYAFAIVSLFSITVILVGLTASPVNASVKASESFDIEILQIIKNLKEDETRFYFKPSSVVAPQNIGYWKVRIYCEDGAKELRINDIAGNSCGKVSDIATTSINSSFITFVNKTDKTTGFSFKLKSYNKEGKWLHTEKKSFRWK